MLENIAAARGILWDLDNTLYVPSQAVNDTFNMAIARAVLELGADLELEQASRIAEESYRTHRYSGAVFIKQYNIPLDLLHSTAALYLDHTQVDICAETTQLFSKKATEHALITQAARPWALNVLERLGLRPWFPDDRVFAYENYAFESKATSRKSFEMGLSSLNLNPGDVLMVEDTVENLRIPHEMGMTTVLVHHGDVPAELPGYVDIHLKNARDVLFYSSASG